MRNLVKFGLWRTLTGVNIILLCHNPNIINWVFLVIGLLFVYLNGKDIAKKLN